MLDADSGNIQLNSHCAVSPDDILLQVGKGPYASEVSGIVKIGQTMTMVLGVKDDENKFDMMVSVAVQYLHQPILIICLNILSTPKFSLSAMAPMIANNNHICR